MTFAPRSRNTERPPALVGTQVHCPPDHGVAWNFREHRHLAGPGGERRRYLRADFHPSQQSSAPAEAWLREHARDWQPVSA